MKKLHGTYSVQPLTITNSVIAEDAAIDESKLNLHFNTDAMQQALDGMSSQIAAHLNMSSDPHGSVLQQTTIETETIHSNESDSRRIITISNPGEGDVSLQVNGDISAVNANFSGNTDIAGITTIGGQTHITGNVVIDGNLSVSGETTTVESNTIDYDSLLVTPSTALNRTGIIVAPDGTGFTGDAEPVTAVETVTVHDDLLNCYASQIKAVKELSNHDLVFLFEDRIVRTNSGVSEIKYTADAGADIDFEYIATDENDNIYVVLNDLANEVVKVKKFDSELNALGTSNALNTPEGLSIASGNVCDFEYLDGRFYITLVDNTLNYCDNTSGLNCFDTLSSGTDAESITGNNSSLLYSCTPFVDPESENTYICCICSDSIYLLDSTFTVASANVFGSLGDVPAEIFQQAFFDPVTHSIFIQSGKAISICVDILPFLSGEQNFLNCNPTTSSGTSDFGDIMNTSGAVVSYLGATDSGLFIFFNASEPELEWVDSSLLPPMSMSYEEEPGEEPEVISVVTNTRATASIDSFPAAVLHKEGAGFFTEDQGTIYFIGDPVTAVQGGGGSPEYIQRLDPSTGILDSVTKVVRRSANKALYNIDPTGYYETTVRAIEVFPDDNVLGIIEKDETYLSLADMTDGTWSLLYTTQLDGYMARLHPAGSIVRNDEKQLVFLAYNYTQNDSPIWEVRIYATDPSAEKLNTIGIQQLLSSAEPVPAHTAISADGNWLYFTAYETGEEIPDSGGDCVKTLKLIGVNLNATGSLSASSDDAVVLSPDLDSSNIPSTLMSGTSTSAITVTSDNRAILAIGCYSYDSVNDSFQPTTYLAEVDLSDGSILSVKNMGNNFIHNMFIYDDNIFIGTTSIDLSAANPFSGNTILKADISTPGSVGTVNFTDIVALNSSNESVDVIRTETTETEVEGLGDTFLGNLLELQTRTRGLNEAAVIVDKDGNLKLLTGGLEVGGIKGAVNNNTLTFDKGLGAASMITSNAGFIYKPSSDAQPGSKVLDIQDASGISNAFITKNGDATVNSLTIGGSSAITEVGTGLVISNDVNISSSELLLDDSALTLSAQNKNEWRMLNRNSTVSFYYDTQSTPQVELGNNLLDASNCITTKVNDLVVLGSATFSGNVNMGSNMTMDGIKVGSHDHTGGDMGTVLPQTAVTGLKSFIDNINTTIQNCVDTMTKSNTESGINVDFNTTSRKLNFAVNDFTLTLSGDVQGSATVAHASNTTLSVTVKNSAKLGGLSLSSTTANTEANKVLRTDANGKTTVKALFISSPTAAGASTLGNIYASIDGETEVKAYTPANFATQLLALGGTTKNSHTHTAVNGLTPVRGSSTFNGVSGRVVMLSTSRANTNYSVAITPTAQPEGHLGEIWVIKAVDRFTVYNSGTTPTAFDYILMG